MKLVIQKCQQASVTVEGKITGKIGPGYVVLVGFKENDTPDEIAYLVDKLIHLRLFEDATGKMNLSLLDIGGRILSVSQFTLYADTTKGRRPSYSKALNAFEAKQLYELFNQKLKEKKITVETGIFGAMMEVTLTNYGPTTIIMER